MTDLKSVLVVVSIISLVSGLSLSSISVWALNAKYHRAEDWYPKTKNISQDNGDLGNSVTKHEWDKIRVSWNDHREMCLAAIGINFSSGLLQAIVAMILLYGTKQASPKTLLGRYALSSMAISLVLMVCMMITVFSDLTKPSELSEELKNYLELDHDSPVLENLQYGIRAYELLVIFDIITVLSTIIAATCYIKCAKPDILSTLEIVEVHDPKDQRKQIDSGCNLLLK